MKKIIFKIIRLLGLPLFFREVIQRNKVTLIMFHDLNKLSAEKTFTYLSKKYNIISLNKFIEANKEKNKKSIPKKALIITFDDGHIGNHDLLSEIKKQKIPITIFLCASIINTNRHFWFKYNHKKILISRLKHMSNQERLQILERYGFEEKKEFISPQALTKQQIEEMKPYVNFQSHTLFHPILPKCTDIEAENEILNSKYFLENEFGLNVNAIAFPNGDYSDRDIKLCKKAGYSCAITVDFGYNTINTNLFRLKRFSVNDTNDINELIVKASGIWAFLKTKNGKKQSYGWTNKTEN